MRDLKAIERLNQPHDNLANLETIHSSNTKKRVLQFNQGHVATQKSLLNSTSPQRLSPQGPSKKHTNKKVGKKERKETRKENGLC